MSLFYVSLVTTVVSIAYNYSMTQKAKKAAEKARKEAEQKAELQKGFQYVEEGTAKPLPIAYGRSKIGGVRVHFKVTDNYNYAAPASGGLIFESMQQADNAQPIVYKLVNSNPEWTGTWSYILSSKSEFLSNPGWITTKDEINNWKYPDREYIGDLLTYAAPNVDFVYCPFKISNPSIRPSASLTALGFSFPSRIGITPVLDTYIAGEKNEFLFVQQAISQGGLHEIYTVDIDSKPYTYDAYSYGMRIHAYKNGSIADPLMVANDTSRSNARFTNVAYATCAFKLNRDDPQYNGTPDVQFYIEGNKVYDIEKYGSVYNLSTNKIYTNNSALILLDYLTNSKYGKGISISDIDLESFYNAKRICNIIVKPSVQNKGKLALVKGGTKAICLYETNLILDSAASARDNVQKILDTMSMSNLVWTEGKYRLNLPYAYIYKTGVTYQTDDIVQITDNNGKNRLYRALQSTSVNPIGSQQWAEDVIPDQFKNINDDHLILDSEVLISWPDSSTKLNFATIRFLNEEKDFSEDTISWPEKEPTEVTDTVYKTFLQEDNGIALETEVFEDGCVTPYHAKAKAEQRVRASRDIISYNFKAIASVFSLEPGDLFGFSSVMYNIPYTILKVDEIATEEGGVVKITASTFDAKLLAWNVADDFYSPLPDNFEGYSLKQAKNLRIVVGQSDNKTSNYILVWDGAADTRVSKYIVKYTTDSVESITSTTVWTDLITTSSTSYELPALDGQFTFTVVSMAPNGRQAQFRNYSEGSVWPLIGYKMTSTFLDGFDSLNAVLSNDTHALLANADGIIPTANYSNSGTIVKFYSGSTALIYDGIGTIPGTWKITAPIGNQSGISCGTITRDLTNSENAIVGPHSNMSGNTAEINFIISGTTISGASFSLNKKQTFTKVFPAGDIKLSATSQIFSIAQTGTVTPSKVDFSVLLQNTSQTVTWNITGGTLTLNGDGTRSLTYANMTAEQAVITATAGNFSDKITITKLREGVDSYSAFLTNESHTLQADSSGTVTDFSNASTSLLIYKGTVNDTSNWTYHVSGITSGISYRDNDDVSNRTLTGTTNGIISAFPFKIVAMTVNEGYVDITATRTGQTITKRFSISKARAGYDAKVYTISLSAPVIFKDSPNKTIDGIHSNITATGERTIGNTTETFGYLTATLEGSTEAASATANSITTSIANNADISYITFKLYESAAKGTVLDSINVPIIFKGATGSSALNIALSNSTHAIPCNESGTPISYANSGTNIYIYEGGNALSYDGVGTSNGTWRIDSVTTSGNIIKSNTVTDQGSYVSYGDHSFITNDTASITYTAKGKTSEGIDFTLAATQTFSKINYGTDARYIYISSTAQVISKDAATAILDGVHTNFTVTGKRAIGDVISDFGYVTIQSDKDATESTRATSITTNIANNAKISGYTVRLYETFNSAVVLDTEYIPVVFKGLKGSGAINVVISNSTSAIPCESDGTVLANGYDNSGTSIYVYEGASRLVYDGIGTTNGRWKVTSTAINITVGSVTDSGDYATYGNHSGMTSENAVITYTITGKTSEGTDFSFTTDQTLIKARRGETVIEAYLSNQDFYFTTDENGTISNYTGSGTDISVYEGNSKLVYDGVGTTNGKWKVTAAGTFVTPSATITDLGDDARYGVVSAMTADQAAVVFTITGKSTTGKTFTITKQQNLNKRKQGITGKKSTELNLYQWALSAPATPTGTSLFNWSTLTNTDYLKYPNTVQNLDSWQTFIPNNPGTPLLKLWVATVRIEVSNSTTTTSVDWTNASVRADSQNGQAGLNVATATLFKWATTIPAAPTGTNIWTWALNDFDSVSSTNTTNGWSKAPSSSFPGMTLWAAEVKLSDSANQATTSINWTTASINARAYAGSNGANGTNGANGLQGASYRLAFAKSATATASGSNIETTGDSTYPANNSFGLSGSVWSNSVPSIVAGEYLWQSDGVYNPATNITTWSLPYWSSLKVGNLSAITANLGTVTAGKLENSGFVIDLTNKTITISV